MAGKTYNSTIKFTGQFDTSQITKGLQDIRKQMTNTHIGEDLRQQLETALSKVEANIPALEKFAGKGEYNSKDLQAFQKVVQEVSKDMAALNKIAAEADFTAVFSEADTNKIKNFEKQLSEVENKLKSTKKEIINTFSNTNEGKINGKSNSTLNGFIEQLLSVSPDQMENKLDEIIKEAETQADEAVDKLQNIFKNKASGKTGGTNFINLLFGEDSGVSLKQGKTLGDPKAGGKGAYSVFNDIREQVLKLEKDAGPDKINPIIEAYSNFIKEFFDVPEGKQSVLDNIVTPEIIERLRQFKGPEGIEGLKALIGEEKFKILEDGEAEKLKITQEQAAFLKQRLDELVKSKQMTAEQAAAVMHALDGMNNEIDEGSQKIQKEKAQADALSATFGSLAKRITNSISALTIFNKSIQIVHKAIDSVKELDAAFTQIAIVSGQTNEQAWQMFDSFNKLAKQYSITTKDLTEGAKLFYQQGLSAADTMKMVEASTISAALGEVTMTEAANTLTAAIQGYNESAEVAMAYTDKIAMVGAVSAADFNELSAAMEKTASSAYTAGIDFDHLLGYLGKMIEVTREAPANIGTAMKTIIARFEDMKKDPMALLEDGMSANKVEAALATIGIALRDSAGEFRALQDVMDELGMKWQSLSRNQQAYIATVAAGSRQQSRFLALMNNYDRTMDLVAESQNSAGAAAEQYATYQDSAAAATARLTAAWEEFYKKVVNSEQIVWFIDRLKDLVEIMNNIGPTWSAVIATLGAHSINKIIKKSSWSKIGSLFTQVVKDEDGKEITKTFASSFKEGLKSGLESGLNESSNGLAKKLTEVVKKATEKGMSLATTAGSKLGSVLTSSLGTIVAIGAAITAAVVILKLLGNLNEKITKQEEKRLLTQSEINKKFIEEKENIKKQKRDIEDNLKIYEKYENKVILTNEELQEQNQVVDNLKENNEKLVVTVDKLGKKHILNKQVLQDELDLLKLQEKANDIIIAKNKLKAVKVSDNNLQDLTIEQLTNSGYSQDEAELLDNYGNLFKTHRLETQGSWFGETLFKQMTMNAPTQNIAGDIKKVMKDNNIEDIIGLNQFDIAKILKSKDLGLISQFLENIKNTLSMSDDESLNNVLNFIIEKAEIAKDGLTLLEGQSQKLANSLAGINLDFEDNVIQNDFNNLINNIGLYGDGELFEIPEEYADNADKIEEIVNQQVDSWNEAIKNINSSEKTPFDNFIKKLLDPTLSQTDRDQLIEKFRLQYTDLYQSFEGLILHFQNGSQLEQNRREELTSLLGGMNLDEFNLSDLTLIDRLIDNSEGGADKVKEGLSEGWSKNYLKALSTFQEDVIENPAIYKPVHDATIEMWQESFGLNELEATNLFEEMYGNFPELALSSAKESFSKAKDMLSMGPTDSLSEDQYSELETLLGDNLRYYTEINKEGEKYLTINGRIVLLEQQREKYAKAILAEIENNVQKIQDTEKATGLTEEQQRKQINNYNRENELLAQQLKKLQDIEGLTATTVTARSNIEYADNYYKNLDAIKQAEEEMVKLNGRLNRSTADTIMAMSDEYIKYLTVRETGEGIVYELTAENAAKIREIETGNYNNWLNSEREKIQQQINDLDVEIDYFQAIADGKKEINNDEYHSHVDSLNKALQKEKESSEKELNVQDQEYNQKLIAEAQFGTKYVDTFSQWVDQAGAKWNTLIRSINGHEEYDSDEFSRKNINPNEMGDIGKIDLPEPIVNDENPGEGEDDTTEEWVNKYLERAKAARDRLIARLAQLQILAPDLEIPTGGSVKELENLTKALEDAADAVENLDELLKDLPNRFKDIDFDYSPFTEMFEEWEHEWDYFFNINRLRGEIDTKGTFIDNILSNDFTNPEDYLKALKAKSGNIISKIAANDGYIDFLREGMSQAAANLEANYGKYYKVSVEGEEGNLRAGQIYQTDMNLMEINEIINARRQELYDLEKIANKDENDLKLQESKLKALEEQHDVYEDTLDKVNEELDSLNKLKEEGNTEVDTSELEAQQAALETQLQINENSIKETEEVIKGMKDSAQDADVRMELLQSEIDGLQGYVDNMNSAVEEYKHFWDEINGTIAENQQLLQELVDQYNAYKDIAISVQQEIYDAIVENYQKEINEKKKQYDYLKKLDDDYLKTIKNNISEQRKAREDANKQKNYQQNIQRAQLLQMDTSGAFKNELASLSKEIESQREDLYDDLVDKQVEALEKEIEKRHELYDKEVAALEERLSFYQENASLLWEKVNNIVGQGTDAMIATLENTAKYMQSSELSREELRNQWERSAFVTYEAVKNNELEALKYIIKSGEEMLKDTYPEINESIYDFGLEFEKAKAVWEASQVAMQTYNDLLLQGMDAQEAAELAMVAAVLKFTESMSDTAALFGKNFGDTVGNIKDVANQWGIDFTALTSIFTNENKELLERMGFDVDTILGNWGTSFSGLAADFGIILADDAEEINQKINGSINTFDDKLQNEADELTDGITDKVDKFGDELVDKVDQFGDELVGETRDFGDGLDNEVDEFGSTLNGDASEITDGLRDNLNGFGEGLSTELNTFGRGVTGKVGTFGEGLSTELEKFGDGVTGNVGAFGEGLSTQLGTFGNGVTRNVSAFGEGLSTQLNTFKDGVAGKIGIFGTSLNTSISGISGTVGNFGSNLSGASGSIGGFNLSVTSASTNMGKFSNGIISNSKDFFNKINGQNGLTGSISAIQSVFNTDKESFIKNSGKIWNTGHSYFTSTLNSYMGTWVKSTSTFTGYSKDWVTLTGDLKEKSQKNLQALQALNKLLTDNNAEISKEEQKLIKDVTGIDVAVTTAIGSIYYFDDKLKESTSTIYDDFISERKKYKNELNTIIEKIQKEISDAVKAAAEAIKNAVSNIGTGGGSGGGGDSGGGGGGGNSEPAPTQPTPNNPNPGSDNSDSSEEKYPGWQVSYRFDEDSPVKVNTQRFPEGGEVTWSQIESLYDSFMKQIRNAHPNATFWGLKHLATGGLVDFTGPAWLDGTKSRPERVLSAEQTKAFDNLVDALTNINSFSSNKKEIVLDESQLKDIIQRIVEVKEILEITSGINYDNSNRLLEEISDFKDILTNNYNLNNNMHFHDFLTSDLDYIQEYIKNTIPASTLEYWFEIILSCLIEIRDWFKYPDIQLNEDFFKGIEDVLKENNHITDNMNYTQLFNDMEYIHSNFDIASKVIKDDLDTLLLENKLNYFMLIDEINSSMKKISENLSSNPSYNIGDINTTIKVDKIDDNTDINRIAKEVENKILNSIKNRVTVAIN